MHLISRRGATKLEEASRPPKEKTAYSGQHAAPMWPPVAAAARARPGCAGSDTATTSFNIKICDYAFQGVGPNQHGSERDNGRLPSIAATSVVAAHFSTRDAHCRASRARDIRDFYVPFLNSPWRGWRLPRM